MGGKWNSRYTKNEFLVIQVKPTDILTINRDMLNQKTIFLYWVFKINLIKLFTILGEGTMRIGRVMWVTSLYWIYKRGLLKLPILLWEKTEYKKIPQMFGYYMRRLKIVLRKWKNIKSVYLIKVKKDRLLCLVTFNGFMMVRTGWQYIKVLFT